MDRISSLPQPILHRILSFLSDPKTAVQTSLLSKSWRRIWSTHPVFTLDEELFGENHEQFLRVLDNTLHGYHDQNLCLEEFDLRFDTPDTVSLLNDWIPILLHNMRVNKFSLFVIDSWQSYFDPGFQMRGYIDLLNLNGVFLSEHLQHLCLRGFKLHSVERLQLKNLRRLVLNEVHVRDNDFQKIILSCPLLEYIFLIKCKELRNIRLSNIARLKVFSYIGPHHRNTSIEIHHIPTIEEISIVHCHEWYNHPNPFHRLKSLSLEKVGLSTKWFDSFSSNFPCIELFQVSDCYGFTRFQLSSASIKNLKIISGDPQQYSLEEAAIDAPNIADFHYQGFIPLSLSFTATSGEWSSHMDFNIVRGGRVWLRKLNNVLRAASRSKIYLKISKPCVDLWDIPTGCSFYQPVVLEQLCLAVNDPSSSTLSDFIIGLFHSISPRELGECYYCVDAVSQSDQKFNQLTEILCKILLEAGGEMGYWKQHLDEVILEASYPEEGTWRRVHATSWFKPHAPILLTKGWLEPYVAILLKKCHQRELRFRLSWIHK